MATKKTSGKADKATKGAARKASFPVVKSAGTGGRKAARAASPEKHRSPRPVRGARSGCLPATVRWHRHGRRKATS